MFFKATNKNENFLKIFLFILINIFGIRVSQASSCKHYLTVFSVPSGFDQKIYDLTFERLKIVSEDFKNIESKSNEFSLLEKAHIIALVNAADISIENSNSIDRLSMELPERLRALFVKMAHLILAAKSGSLSEIVLYLDSLLYEKKYEEWLSYVSNLHRALRSPTFASNIQTHINLSSSIEAYFSNLGFRLDQIYDPSSDQFSYPVFKVPLQWKSPDSLTVHFDKRRLKDGMKLVTEDDLVLAANQFLSSNRTDQLVFFRNDGTSVKYDSITSELAIVSSDNTIITYYYIKDRSPEELAAYMKYVFTEPPVRKN